jgi:hypothetical protein
MGERVKHCVVSDYRVVSAVSTKGETHRDTERLMQSFADLTISSQLTFLLSS